MLRDFHLAREDPRGAPESTRRLRLPLLWQVEERQGGKPYRLGVEPDRVFGLQFDDTPENRRRAYFFLEADRVTMPITRKGLLVQTSALTVTTSRECVHLVAASRTLSLGVARASSLRRPRDSRWAKGPPSAGMMLRWRFLRLL